MKPLLMQVCINQISLCRLSYYFLFWFQPVSASQTPITVCIGYVIGHVSLALENEVGGRKHIFSMLTYRTLFCFLL